MSKLVGLLGASAILLVVGLTSGATVDQSPWDSSVDAVTKGRFIPVELWTGAEWTARRN